MASKRVTTVEDIPTTPESEGVQTPEERAAEDELQLALAEIGDTEGKVQCIRTAPKDEQGMAGTYSAQEFTVERLRDEWGGGTYMLYFRLANGQLKTKRRIQVLARKTPPVSVDRTTELLAALQAKPQGDNTTLILQLMQSQQKSTMDLFAAMITAQGNNKSQSMGATEVVSLLGAIQGLNKNTGKETSSLDELVKVLKVAKELGGDGGGDDGILGKLATMAGPLLERLADRIPAAPTPAPRSPVPIVATSTRAAAPSPPVSGTASEFNAASENEDVNLRLIGWLRETLQTVLAKAEKGKDPELYADWVLDNLPEGLGADVILAKLEPDDAIDQLAFFDGRVLQYREWLEEFRDAIVERIQEAQETDRRTAEVTQGSPSSERGQSATFVPTPDPVATLYTDPNPGGNDPED